MAQHRRPTYSPEFRAEVVKLVRTSPDSASKIARDLGITVATLGRWVQATRPAPEVPLTDNERTELRRLRRENRELRMERDILKKATAGSRRRCNAGRQSISRRVVIQRLARTHIEAACHRIEIGLGVSREVGTVGEILPEQAVRIFV
jgi:transposase